jgi:hypothetical protein
MQISGANLLIAAQQQPQAAARAPEHPGFAATLNNADEAKDAGFAPLDFKAAEHPAKPAPMAPAQPLAGEQKPAQSLGSTLDIRV